MNYFNSIKTTNFNENSDPSVLIAVEEFIKIFEGSATPNTATEPNILLQADFEENISMDAGPSPVSEMNSHTPINPTIPKPKVNQTLYAVLVWIPLPESVQTSGSMFEMRDTTVILSFEDNLKITFELHGYCELKNLVLFGQQVHLCFHKKRRVLWEYECVHFGFEEQSDKNNEQRLISVPLITVNNIKCFCR